MYFVLKPEVAGGRGPTTVADRTVHPPIISKLEYRFEGWSGDDILESFPCFIVTERLRTALEQTTLTGYEFADVTITRSEEFNEMEAELHPDRVLPDFKWLKVGGHCKKNDFGITNDYNLCVSPAAMEVLQQFNIQHCLIKQVK